jgi:hypothetical protein
LSLASRIVTPSHRPQQNGGELRGLAEPLRSINPVLDSDIETPRRPDRPAQSGKSINASGALPSTRHR